MATLYTILTERPNDIDDNNNQYYDAYIIASNTAPVANTTYETDDGKSVVINYCGSFSASQNCCINLADYKTLVRTVTVEDSVASYSNNSLGYTFNSFTNLEYIYKIENLFENMGKTNTDRSSILSGCVSLKKLDFSKSTFKKVFTPRNNATNKNNFYKCWTHSSTTGLISCEEIILPQNDADPDAIYNLSDAFRLMRSLKTIDLSPFNGLNISNAQYMFNECFELKHITFPKITIKPKTTTTTTVTYPGDSTSTVHIINDCSVVGMFDKCISLETVDLKTMKAETPLKMNNMFTGCENLKYVDLSHLTAYSPYLYDMFDYSTLDGTTYTCNSLLYVYPPKIEVKDNNDVYMYININSMFNTCENLYMVDFSKMQWYKDAESDENEPEQIYLRAGWCFQYCGKLKYIYSTNKTALTIHSNSLTDSASKVFEGCNSLPNFTNNSGSHSYVGEPDGYFTDAAELKYFNINKLIEDIGIDNINMSQNTNIDKKPEYIPKYNFKHNYRLSFIYNKLIYLFLKPYAHALALNEQKLILNLPEYCYGQFIDNYAAKFNLIRKPNESDENFKNRIYFLAAVAREQGTKETCINALSKFFGINSQLIDIRADNPCEVIVILPPNIYRKVTSGEIDVNDVIQYFPLGLSVSYMVGNTWNTGEWEDDVDEIETTWSG